MKLKNNEKNSSVFFLSNSYGLRCMAFLQVWKFMKNKNNYINVQTINVKLNLLILYAMLVVLANHFNCKFIAKPININSIQQFFFLNSTVL